MDREATITASAARLASNDAWQDAQRTAECIRLRRVLRYAHLTKDERKIAEDMLDFWVRESELNSTK